jgi:hypothetical protein
MIADLAKRLRRSQGDAVRLVIREAVLSLHAQTNTPTERDAMQREENYAFA